nr:PREDICTED: BAG family molecular chaperone regulator 4-like [Daucus carota subsp. sativus]
MAPNVQRLFFKGIEERDQECLEIAGLKNNSKLLLRKSARNDRVEEVPASDDEIEVVKVTQKSKGSELVAEVKVDNDKLAAQVGALRKVICEGHKVFHKDLNILVEMLERQLLKLDGIKAEGEGKLQRKMEEIAEVIVTKRSKIYSYHDISLIYNEEDKCVHKAFPIDKRHRETSGEQVVANFS